MKEYGISKEDLYTYFVKERHTRKETAEHFGVREYVIGNLMLAFGLKKPKRKELLEQYPVQEIFDYYRDHGYWETCQTFNIPKHHLDHLLHVYNAGKKGQVDRAFCKISKEDLNRYYIEENHSREETLEHFKLSTNTLVQLLRRYGIKKSAELAHQNQIKTNLQKYGVESYRSTQECKDKIRQTSKARYGTDHPFQNPIVQARQQDSVERKYGVRHALQSDEIKAKFSRTNVERYGAQNIMQSGEGKFRAQAGCMAKYGVAWNCMRPEARMGYSNDSKPNLKFAAFLESYNIQDYEREFPIANRSYDFKIGTKLIEINPSATHNSTRGIFGSKPKEPTYHLEKTKLARENGYQCIHVFDWDDWDKVIQLLEPRQTLYARKLELKEISQLEANRFLKQYHLQGGAKLQTVCYGLFLGQELIEVMTFGKPRFNKNYQWELIRLCTKARYCVVGGAERMFKAFIKKEQPESIISYCDDAKFTGNVYTRLGFKHQSTGAISKHWYNPETGVHITDNGLRMRGFDKLLGETYGQTYGKGTSNEDLMREHGFVEVYDAGQSVYVWNKGSNGNLKEIQSKANSL